MFQLHFGTVEAVSGRGDFLIDQAEQSANAGIILGQVLAFHKLSPSMILSGGRKGQTENCSIFMQ